MSNYLGSRFRHPFRRERGCRRRLLTSTSGGALGLLPPTPKASKTRAFTPARGGLGVLGIKIDKYVAVRLFSGIREGESPRVAFTPCEP